jgi:hypothetical protein
MILIRCSPRTSDRKNSSSRCLRICDSPAWVLPGEGGAYEAPAQIVPNQRGGLPSTLDVLVAAERARSSAGGILLRSAQGDVARLPGLVAELIGLGVDVLIVVGPQAVQAARAAVSVTPIVAIDRSGSGHRDDPLIAIHRSADRRSHLGQQSSRSELTFQLFDRASDRFGGIRLFHPAKKNAHSRVFVSDRPSPNKHLGLEK